jgi:prepilin-type N-terminal cleavage/methylation domain-containing protein
MHPKLTGRKNQAGLTLLEMSVVLLIASTIMIASFQLLDETNKMTQFVETRNDLPLIGQGAMNTLQNALSQSRQVFDASGIGPAYFSALRFSTSAPLLTGSRMPVAHTTGTYQSGPNSGEPAPMDFLPDSDWNAQFDPDGTWTGNCLLVARQLAPIDITYTGGTLSVDRYRFEFFYLTAKNNWKFSGATIGHLDAMRGRSREYADYFQLSTVSLTAPQRTEVNTKLIAANIAVAWNPGTAITAAIYDVRSNGTYSLVNNPQIFVDTVDSITPRIEDARIFGRMAYTVAFRGRWTDTLLVDSDHDGTADAPLVAMPIPKFATYNSGTPLVPSGMEFKIVGIGSSQRVLSRVVVLAHYHAREYAAQESVLITAPSGGV